MLSVRPGEYGDLAGPAGDEVFTLFPLEGQQADGGLCVRLYFLLGLIRAVPGGDDEPALLPDDLRELLVASGPAGVRIAELRRLPQHVLLDLAHHGPQSCGQLLSVHKFFLSGVAPDEDGLLLLDVPRPQLHAYGHTPELVFVELPARRMLFVEVYLHPDVLFLQFRVQGLGLAAHLSLVLAPPDRDDDGLGRCDPGRQSEAPVVAMDQDQTPYGARGEPPRGLVGIDPVLVLVEEGDVEGAGEVLSEVVAGRGLQGAPVAHQPLAGVGLYRPGETLRLALRAREDGYRHCLVEAIAVDAEHPQGLLPRLLRCRVDGVALLPEELRAPEERAGDLLPAQDVTPLVYENRQVSVALDPVPVEVADDAL